MRRANLFLAVALIVSAAVELRGQSQQKNNARGFNANKDKPHILDRKGLPLFLSTEVFDAAGGVKRRVYVRYETDKFVRDDGTGSTTDANARLVATRTVFEDDGGRFTEKQYENFDGLGHHRTVTSYSDFKTGDQRADITLYNPDRGVYVVNQISNQADAAAGHTYTPFPAARPWVLDTYSAVISGDYEKTSASFYNFDQRGLLLSKRVKKEFDEGGDRPAARPDAVPAAAAHAAVVAEARRQRAV